MPTFMCWIQVYSCNEELISLIGGCQRTNAWLRNAKNRCNVSNERTFRSLCFYFHTSACFCVRQFDRSQAVRRCLIFSRFQRSNFQKSDGNVLGFLLFRYSIHVASKRRFSIPIQVRNACNRNVYFLISA